MRVGNKAEDFQDGAAMLELKALLVMTEEERLRHAALDTIRKRMPNARRILRVRNANAFAFEQRKLQRKVRRAMLVIENAEKFTAS
jgi:hypothetical protein